MKNVVTLVTQQIDLYHLTLDHSYTTTNAGANWHVVLLYVVFKSNLFRYTFIFFIYT